MLESTWFRARNKNLVAHLAILYWIVHCSFGHQKVELSSNDKLYSTGYHIVLIRLPFLWSVFGWKCGMLVKHPCHCPIDRYINIVLRKILDWTSWHVSIRLTPNMLHGDWLFDLHASRFCAVVSHRCLEFRHAIFSTAQQFVCSYDEQFTAACGQPISQSLVPS